MTNTPADDLQDDNIPDFPEHIERLSFVASVEEMDVPVLYTAKNSPPTCHIVAGDVRVRIPSQTAGGMVDAEVDLADPITRMCHATYSIGGRSMQKWISFDETVPPLEMTASASPERPTIATESADVIAEQTRQRANVMTSRQPVLLKRGVISYAHDAYPNITAAFELARPTRVTVYSKTQGQDVRATVDMVSEDLRLCRVTYMYGTDGQFKWVSVDNVRPPLLVIADAFEGGENNAE